MMLKTTGVEMSHATVYHLELRIRCFQNTDQ